jgi:hypothetical protein
VTVETVESGDSGDSDSVAYELRYFPNEPDSIEVSRGSTVRFFILFGSFSTKTVQLLREVEPGVGLESNLGSTEV